jgi:NTE family protein
MQKPTGLVLAGAVARGAYEAGALSVLLPFLEGRNERPTVLVGTSAGAINAAFLASRADLSAETATKDLLELWGGIKRKNIFDYSLLALPALIWQELGLSQHPRGILDTEPLKKTLSTSIGDWNRIRRNIRDGHLDALAVVTTASRTGRSVVFVEGGVVGKRGRRRLPDRDDKKGIEYEAPVDGIGVTHVLASAAMPILFPPVRIVMADGTSDWFFDGGLRLNTPIKPAIQLGVDRVAIVASDPARHSAEDHQTCGRIPDLDDFILHFLQAALADPLIEDMWRLARINTLLDVEGSTDGKRQIEYLFVGPRKRGELGCTASQVVGQLQVSEFKALGWLLGRQGSQHHELLSYLLFEPAFFKEAIELGKRDARREIGGMDHEEPHWRLEPPQKESE